VALVLTGGDEASVVLEGADGVSLLLEGDKGSLFVGEDDEVSFWSTDGLLVEGLSVVFGGRDRSIEVVRSMGGTDCVADDFWIEMDGDEFCLGVAFGILKGGELRIDGI